MKNVKPDYVCSPAFFILSLTKQNLSDKQIIENVGRKIKYKNYLCRKSELTSVN